MPHITVHLPMSESLSSGLDCFEVKNMTAADVIKRLGEKKFIASVTPDATKYARLDRSAPLAGRHRHGPRRRARARVR